MLKYVLIATFVAGACFAQDQGTQAASEQPKYFRLEIVVKEVEAGKVINARAYSLTASTEAQYRGSIRTGNRVPYEVKTGEFNFADVGVNIDCYHVREAQNQLTMDISVEVSSLVGDSQANPRH